MEADSVFGLPLECFVDGESGYEVLVCLDEEGTRFEYKGPQNPQSTSTIYGRWTGPGAYCDDVPVKVRGRNGKQTSALDSFSMLYAIQCNNMGYHNESVNVAYVERIREALKRGIINTFRDMEEFMAASKIVSSFVRTGHVFDLFTSDDNSVVVMGGVSPQDVRWSSEVPGSYPMFDLTEEELDLITYADEQNGGVSVETDEQVMKLLAVSGMEKTYMFHWFRQKMYEQQQLSFAMSHVREQLGKVVARKVFLPQWDSIKDRPFKRVRSAVRIETIAEDITAEIIRTLL